MPCTLQPNLGEHLALGSVLCLSGGTVPTASRLLERADSLLVGRPGPSVLCL